MKDHHEKYRNLKKSCVRDKDTLKFKQKVLAFKTTSEKLFDIGSCKCFMKQETCYCEKKSKVPNAQIEFLADQRKHRRMVMDESGDEIVLR